MYFALDFEAKVTGSKMSAATTLNELKTWVGCNSAQRFFPAVERAAQRSQFALCELHVSNYFLIFRNLARLSLDIILCPF